MTAVLVAAVIFFLLYTLPPLPLRADWSGDASLAQRTVAGAYHVHTTRSDGVDDRAAVAASAARAGLQFVIFTDHGDGTRPPEPPAYLSGVLCVDGVEISTNGGHYVALGMSPAPYRLGGEAEAVVEDVARLGGFGFTAHPDSMRPELAWTDWSLPLDGIEWINADSEWRDEPRGRLTRTMFHYFFRPAPALGAMLDRPVATLARWDALSMTRAIVALAGHDAHGGIGKGAEDGGRRGIPIPSYEASFRSFSTRAVLDAPLSGRDAAMDAHALLTAIRTGRVFTAVDAVADPALLDLRASSAGIRADASMPPGAELVLLRDGVESQRVRQGHIAARPDPGGFRVEVQVPGSPGTPPVPWILSNVVYAIPPTAPPMTVVTPGPLHPFPAGLAWRVEHDPSSGGTASATDRTVTLEYRLGPGERDSVFAALAVDLPEQMPPAQGLAFRAHASRPMRVSVQLRSNGGGRWGRSVYVGTELRDVGVALDSLIPLDGQAGRAPSLSSVRSLLFVVDRTNATPGDSGRFDISNLGLTARGGG